MKALKISTIPVLCLSTTDALVPQVQRNAINNHQSTRQHEKHSLQSRRDVLRYAFLLTPIVATAITSSGPANALEACKPKSHNCIRTTWTAPSSLTTPSEVAKVIRDVLNSYPQEGQAGVDCNGWRIVNDALDEKAGIITLEYKSCVGPAALAINLGQPFIDDCKLELGKDSTGSITVEVKSSSRMGSGDLSVNRKRLQYLGKKLKQEGWSVPNPKYVYEM
mmetsp:Transcript_22033/g.47914  ORF Transcript_22033/g.47914 Transcript_22033/m.47914 type:complete len:221 (+) Transcript_22033:95-757(+)|eukprot:CAMPEP_0172316048 /NCGR_PEP_ID=MMETSP1058-20130122/27099_1 /TAXON_ID=83371 /ORGANISM="Detonula confervacea, Strain CCMP 353" /LENGTH=220 /DNA_ID=CAMNT_0013030271 /DNA_START=80 /DNA_END=742 /DNA_ORIENTATION=+